MCVSVFIPSCPACVYSSMDHLHQPPHQASSCLSVCPYSCVHVCVCVCVSSNALWGQVRRCFASHFSRDPSSCPWRSRPSHPHRASLCPTRIKLFRWDGRVQMVRGLETGDTYYACRESGQQKVKLYNEIRLKVSTHVLVLEVKKGHWT